MARPPKADTVQFRRKLDNPKLQILLVAGQGNISKGFENILALYQYCHNEGYRPTMPLSSLGIVGETTNSPNLDESLRDSKRDSIENV